MPSSRNRSPTAPEADPAGQVRGDVVSSLDLLPTFAAAANTQPVEKASGINLLPHLTDSDSKLEKRSLIWRRGQMANLALLHGNLKWTHNRATDETALYDLEKDVSEKNNIAAQHPEAVDQLAKQYEQWEASAPPPAFESNWKPKKKK